MQEHSMILANIVIFFLNSLSNLTQWAGILALSHLS